MFIRVVSEYKTKDCAEEVALEALTESRSVANSCKEFRGSLTLCRRPRVNDSPLREIASHDAAPENFEVIGTVQLDADTMPLYKLFCIAVPYPEFVSMDAPVWAVTNASMSRNISKILSHDPQTSSSMAGEPFVPSIPWVSKRFLTT